MVRPIYLFSTKDYFLGAPIKSFSGLLVSIYCQRASRAKTRGWRGGSIIEPSESTVQADKISSDREICL